MDQHQDWFAIELLLSFLYSIPLVLCAPNRILNPHSRVYDFQQLDLGLPKFFHCHWRPFSELGIQPTSPLLFHFQRPGPLQTQGWRDAWERSCCCLLWQHNQRRQSQDLRGRLHNRRSSTLASPWTSDRRAKSPQLPGYLQLCDLRTSNSHFGLCRSR